MLVYLVILGVELQADDVFSLWDGGGHSVLFSARAQSLYVCVCTGFPSFSGTNVLLLVCLVLNILSNGPYLYDGMGGKYVLQSLSPAAYLEQSVALLNRVLLPILV